MAMHFKDDFLMLLSSIALLIDLENKNPISLLIAPKSDNELSLASISFFIFNLNGFGILIE
jgi:hypothetical protein